VKVSIVIIIGGDFLLWVLERTLGEGSGKGSRLGSEGAERRKLASGVWDGDPAASEFSEFLQLTVGLL